MKFQFEETRIPSVSVPARVVDGLLGIATGAQLKVLLFLMRFDKMAHEAKDIASFCNIAEEEVAAAVDFWVKERVLAKEEGRLRLVGAVKTLQARELPRVQPTVILEETAPDFRAMVAEVQRLTGKPMGQLMLSTLYNMAENLHFSPEMICEIAAYCNAIDKFSPRYLETVAIDWYDNGIDTFEKAEEKIRALENARKLEARLARDFGVKTAFSARQREQIARWQAWGFGAGMIREAYDRCMDRKGQMSFAYMDKILADWHEKGFTAPDQIVDQKPEETGRRQHEGLSELERKAIEKMQAGGAV